MRHHGYRNVWVGIGLSALLLSAAGSALLAQERKPAERKPAATKPAATKPAALGDRFDYRVREDFFAGFAGDRARLERGMKACEETLAKNPKHAEALVWHGSGLLQMAGAAFGAGDQQKGAELWTRGLKEMDEAAKLEPTNVGVLVPRAAVLSKVAEHVPDARTRKELVTRVVDGYEVVYAQQKDILDKLGTHPRGELLMGLAEGYRKLGDEPKAKTYLELTLKTLKGTSYEREAQQWLAKDAAGGGITSRNCVGCHTP